MIYTVKDKEIELKQSGRSVWDKYLYTGEVDLSDNLCGFGTAMRLLGNKNRKNGHKYEGTFFNGDKYEGTFFNG